MRGCAHVIAAGSCHAVHVDDQWAISSQFGEASLPLRVLASLEVGDVIPLEVPDVVEVCAEELPIFRGQVGVHNNSYAVKITEWIERNSTRQLHDLIGASSNEEGTSLVPENQA